MKLRYKTMKVWGDTCQVTVPMPDGSTQARVIVCARSQKRAVELLNNSIVAGYVTISTLRTWWAETGNEVELATAANREGVWYAPDVGGSASREFKRA